METQFTFVCRGVVDWRPQNDFESGRQTLENKVQQTEAYRAAAKAYNLA